MIVSVLVLGAVVYVAGQARERPFTSALGGLFGGTSGQSADVDCGSGHAGQCKRDEVRRDAGSAGPAARIDGRRNVGGAVEQRKRVSLCPFQHDSQCRSGLQNDWRIGVESAYGQPHCKDP
jgi:hypothetical protein